MCTIVDLAHALRRIRRYLDLDDAKLLATALVSYLTVFTVHLSIYRSASGMWVTSGHPTEVQLALH